MHTKRKREAKPSECKNGSVEQTYNRVLELQLLLLAVRGRLVLFCLLGAPD